MGIISYIKSEIKVIRERDSAIKSDLEALLYPGFKEILSHRVAHKLYLKKIILWQDGYRSELREKRELRHILALK